MNFGDKRRGSPPAKRKQLSMAIFRRRHLRKVLSGDKTQTRRSHKYTWTIGKTYCIRDRWFSKAQGHITVTRKFRQRLSDVSTQDVQKEGFNSLEEFKQEWTELHGSWNPDEIVICYEFKLADSRNHEEPKGR